MARESPTPSGELDDMLDDQLELWVPTPKQSNALAPNEQGAAIHLTQHDEQPPPAELITADKWNINLCHRHTGQLCHLSSETRYNRGIWTA